MRRIPVKRGPKTSKKKKRDFGVTMSQLKKIDKGSELKGIDMCYHCNTEGFHPDTISAFNLKEISSAGKMQIIDYIHKGQIYILKE